MADINLQDGDNLGKVLEGVDQAVREGVLTALEFYGREKSENGNKIEDVVKVNKLRTEYNKLVTSLVTTRLNDLNKNQKLFLCTGAIGDKAVINGNQVNLLESDIYYALLENFDKREEDSEFNQYVFNPLDKMKALAEGKLEIIDTSGKKKRKKEDTRDPKKVKAELEWKRNDSLKAGENFIRNLGANLDKVMQINPAKLTLLKQNYDYISRYFAILAKGEKVTPEEKKLKDALAIRMDNCAKTLADFTKMYAETFTRSNECTTGLKEKMDEIKEKDVELSRVNDVTAEDTDKAVDEFKNDHVDVVKKDISIINSFIVSASEKSANRVPYSGARVLLTNQLPDVPTAMENFLCTPYNVTQSLKKILSFHTNAFPKDEDGNWKIPPILIEPIRNYCDFLEDRFIMGFISGEPAKKGAYVSFNPIDMQVLKAIGMYLAKDPVYDYRGEINAGTFMGDYTGKVEKTAQVKWTGQDKKMNMVMSAELVDAASRDDAVNDYIAFLFNILNGQNPPPKMSKRKITVLLTYTIIKDVENNIRLLLQYVAQSEPIEARETILKFTNRSADAARDIVRKIVKEDQMVQRTLGNNPEMVIKKLFGG